MKAFYIALFCITYSGLLSAQEAGVEYQWKQKRDIDGITVFTSKVAGSRFQAVRTTMLIPTTISSLVALVSDNAACSEWASLCKESKVVEQISATEKYVYNYNNVPFPIKDRDVFSHVVWHHDSATGKVSMTSRATKDRYPKSKKAVRIEKAISQWHFTPQDNGYVLVESFAHVDPNGPTPAWLTNLLLVDTPFKTMKNMRNMITSGRYDEIKISFLP